MQTDIAILGLQVDSRQVKTAKTDLRRLGTQSRETARATDQSTRKMSTGFARLGIALGGLISGFAALRGIQGVVGVTSRFEDLRSTMEVVVGSAKKANSEFDRISDFARTTPFSLEEVTQGYIRLQNAGLEPTERLLRAIADASSVSIDKHRAFKSFTAIFARGIAGGLGIEELERLENVGFPVYQTLQEEIGYSRLEVSKLGQTAAGSKIIIDGLVNGIERLYEGASTDRMDNLTSRFSNFHDAVDQASEAFGKGLAPGIKEATSELTDFFTRNKGGFEEMGKAIGYIGEGFAEIAATARQSSSWLYDKLFEDDNWLARYNRARAEYFEEQGKGPNFVEQRTVKDEEGHSIPMLEGGTTRIDVPRSGFESQMFTDQMMDYVHNGKDMDWISFNNPAESPAMLVKRFHQNRQRLDMYPADTIESDVVEEADEGFQGLNKTIGDTSSFLRDVQYEWSDTINDFVTGNKEAGHALKEFAMNLGNTFEARLLDRLIGDPIKEAITLGLDAALDWIAPKTGGGGIKGFLGMEGGGFTGSAPRAGGVDGRGGFPVILHPDETVIDHRKGGGIGSSVSVVINNNASGVAVEAQPAINGRDLVLTVENIVIGSMAKGKIKRQMETQYGMKQQSRSG